MIYLCFTDSEGCLHCGEFTRWKDALFAIEESDKVFVIDKMLLTENKALYQTKKGEWYK